jgi:hypothetical protein
MSPGRGSSRSRAAKRRKTSLVTNYQNLILGSTQALLGAPGENKVELCTGEMAAKGPPVKAGKVETASAVFFLMLTALGPLSFFSFKLIEARRIAHREIGTLSSRYLDSFRRKWIQEGTRQDEPLLGTSDIQSLADLGNAFNTVSDMRILPFSAKTVVRLAMGCGGAALYRGCEAPGILAQYLCPRRATAGLEMIL